jgi:UDP-N-acetylmuramoyl-tripeptide--D-alanyl-D-alanine ligase
MMMTLAQAHALLPGSRVVSADADQLNIERVHSDTRSLRPGDLFVALRGERFDGHAYLAAARAAGAVAALAEQGLGPTMPGLQVTDSLAALQQLAAAWRQQMTLPVIAVTGSNGKTTVTQMTAAILRAWLGDAALATAGNFNNHIGVPLTLLRLRPQHRAAVLELGMNHEGEIAQLAALAAPTIALVNNAQREHQEFMAGVQAVARENGSVIAALPADGVAVLPAGDEFLPLWRGLAGTRRLLRFGFEPQAEVRADLPEVADWQAALGAWSLHLHTPAGSVSTLLHQAGRHNVLNALAAAACALAAGAPLTAVARGLADFRPVAGRSQLVALRLGGRSVSLVDDSYNANPDSVLAAIEVLAALPGPRWLLLGDMGEVGAEGARFHAEVGERAKARGIEQVWTVGPLSAKAAAHRHFDTVDQMVQALPQQALAAASMLIKGSRFMAMEKVAQALQALSSAQADQTPPKEGPHAA